MQSVLLRAKMIISFIGYMWACSSAWALYNEGQDDCEGAVVEAEGFIIQI